MKEKLTVPAFKKKLFYFDQKNGTMIMNSYFLMDGIAGKRSWSLNPFDLSLW
jgi:hypothetical protein